MTDNEKNIYEDAPVIQDEPKLSIKEMCLWGLFGFLIGFIIGFI